MKRFAMSRVHNHRWTIGVLAVVLLIAGLPADVAGQDLETGSNPTAAPATEAQPTTPARNPFEHLQIGVTLEGYYQYNWNRPFDRVNLLRAYDTRANTFSIQQTAIVIESAPATDEGRRFGGRLDLQFGQATEAAQGNPANEPRPNVYRNVWQAYGTYVVPVGRGLQADFGKFSSNLGYETNYAKDNNNFSRSYLFNFLPFYHSGLRLSLPVTDRVTVLYMLTNGIQQTEDFNNFKSNQVSAIVRPTDRITWTTNLYIGREQPDGQQSSGPDGVFRVFDTYVAMNVTSALSLGLDLNHVTSHVRRGDDGLTLQGTAVYARYQLTAASSLSARYERLDDDGLFSGVDQVLHGITTTAEYKLAEGFLVRGEFRRDWSSRDFFTTNISGQSRDDQNTATVGLVWWFGNKPGAW